MHVYRRRAVRAAHPQGCESVSGHGCYESLRVGVRVVGWWQALLCERKKDVKVNATVNAAGAK